MAAGAGASLARILEGQGKSRHWSGVAQRALCGDEPGPPDTGSAVGVLGGHEPAAHLTVLLSTGGPPEPVGAEKACMPGLPQC